MGVHLTVVDVVTERFLGKKEVCSNIIRMIHDLYLLNKVGKQVQNSIGLHSSHVMHVYTYKVSDID